MSILNPGFRYLRKEAAPSDPSHSIFARFVASQGYHHRYYNEALRTFEV